MPRKIKKPRVESRARHTMISLARNSDFFESSTAAKPPPTKQSAIRIKDISDFCRRTHRACGRFPKNRYQQFLFFRIHPLS